MKQGQKQNIKTDKAYFLTLTIVNWVDAFTRKNHRDAIIESLKYCQKEKGLVVFAYCNMSNHIHIIVKQVHDWIYSSASNYQEMDSIVEVELIPQRLITY